MNDNESTSYSEIATLPARPTAVEMPYSRLESSTRELPRPPVVYDRVTSRRDVEPLWSPDSGEHGADGDGGDHD